MLSLLLPLGEFEPATSLISRLSARHRIEKPRMFCADVGFDINRIVRGDPTELQKLAAAAGVDFERLRHASATVNGASSFKFLGETFHKKDLLRSTVRVCPICIQECADTPDDLPARNSWWKVAALRTCQKHGTMLLHLPRPVYSIDGHDFAGQIREHWHQIVDARNVVSADIQSDFERYVRSRLTDGHQGEWFDQLDLSTLKAAVEALGLLINEGPSASTSQQPEATLHYVANTGFQCLGKTQNEFYSNLKDFVEDEKVGTAQYAGPFGPYFRWLNGSKLPGAEPLRDILREVILDRCSINAGARLLGQEVKGSRYYTIRRARREFKLPEKRLRSVLLHRGLALPSTGADRLRLRKPLTDEILQDIREEMDRRLSNEQVCRHLGINARKLRQLVEQDFLPTSENEEGELFKYLKADVEAFAKRITLNAEKVDYVSTEQVSLFDVPQNLNIYGADLVLLAAAGKLPVAGILRGETGFRSLVFNIDELRATLENDETTALTMRDFRQRVAMSERETQWMIENGHLATTTCPARGPAPLISEAEGIRIFVQYYSLRKMQQRLFMRYPKIRAILDELGIKRVFDDPNAPELYRNNDIQNNWGRLMSHAPKRAHDYAPDSRNPKGRHHDPLKNTRVWFLKCVSTELAEILEAAKKRPQAFSDVVGGEYVVMTRDHYNRLGYEARN